MFEKPQGKPKFEEYYYQVAPCNSETNLKL